MQDAKNDLVGEAEDAAEEGDDDDEDEAIEAKLSDLSELMARITDEVEAFAHLEKQRKSASLASPVVKSVVAGSTSGSQPLVGLVAAQVSAGDGQCTPTLVAGTGFQKHQRHGEESQAPRRTPMGEALDGSRLGMAAARHTPFRSSPLASSTLAGAKAVPKARHN